MQFIGRSGDEILFALEDKAVLIHESKNLILALDLAEPLIASFFPEGNQSLPTSIPYELATSAVTDLDIKVFSNNDRLYTIPKSVQEEAKRGLAWRKEEKRGGTSVGLNSARILARGGQIGIRKIRHINTYFPRHEVDKKGTGYKPGEKNYPSNGRIAWALWGGDSSRSWASAIVERENKKAQNNSITASFDFIMSNYEDPSKPQFDSFIDAQNLSEKSAPQFFIRIRLDGTGIDRLYKVDREGLCFVWDDAMWADLGNINHDFETYDRSLDDPYDTTEKIHVPIDVDTAIVVSGLLDSDPYKSISIEKINPEESRMMADNVYAVEWDFVDELSENYEDFSSDPITAAGEGGLESTKPSSTPVTNQDGNYTPEERSQKASSQVRDKSGKFAQAGGKVVIGGNPAYSGTIQSMDGATQTVKVKLDNGVSVDVPGNTTQDAKTFVPISQNQSSISTKNLTTGILGEPRVPIDRPMATAPDRLPQLTRNQTQTILNDWSSWAGNIRASAPADISKPPTEDITGNYKAPNAYNDPSLRKFLEQKAVRPDGTTYYPNAIWFRPDIAKGVDASKIDKYKPANQLTPSPGKDLGKAPSWMTEKPKSLTSAASVALTPETSDIPPIYMAIVSPDDAQAVMDLIALIPATADSLVPTTFKRKPGKWIQDAGYLNDLNSPTPPPVSVLDDETLQMVLEQIDSVAKTASAYMSDSLLVAIMAAGGVDRNKGNAEELRRYWTKGKGAAKIRWNTPGDWTRCVRQLSKYLGPRAKGYCALRHKEVTGMWTGDKKHRQMDGIKSSAFSNEFILSSEAVIDSAVLRAKASKARSVVYGITSDLPIEESRGLEFSIPLVIPEGIASGDGRQFDKGAITMRELPLPLLWQIKSGEGHSGSVVIGKITHMERVDDGIGNARGYFDTGEYGKEAERLVRGGFIRGVSADMDMFEAKEETNSSEKDSDTKVGGGKMKITKARVMAVTLVPKPAFQECKIVLADEMSANQEDTEMIQDGIYVEGVNPLDASALVACGMVAGAIPVTPPAEWFLNPKLDKPTALTVTDEGKVYGHIAAWHVDHIGMAFGTRPPRSKSNYSYFHTGVCRTEDGNDMPVGQLTLAGGHASLEASAHEAVRHYDDTASAVADVHAGEDKHGIWVSGALRPGTTPEQIRSLRASAPSGDWRPIKGALELVAVCQVNVPGFPIARARVASGQVMALVAAGASVLAQLKYDPLQEVNDRIDKLEQPLLASANAAREKMQALTAAIKGEELSKKIRSIRDEDSAYMLQMLDDTDAELSIINRKERTKLAEEGKALPDGSFPIRNAVDLRNAVQSYGRSRPGQRGKVRRHIMKMARQLDKTDLIPENWTEAIKASVDSDFISSEISKIGVEGLTDKEVSLLEEEVKAKKASEAERAKYTPQTQPRDASGKFRQILARLKVNLGVAGSDAALDKIEETENLDNAGNYAGAAKAAGDLLGIIDRLDTNALNPDSLENIRTSTGELGKVIANLPFAFGEDAEKIRFSDIPPALKDLMRDMIKRVEDKIGKEDAAIATKDLKSFISGGDYYNQSEISSKMSKLLRLLT